MAYTPQEIHSHDPITVDWGNKVEKMFLRLGKIWGVVDTEDDLPSADVPMPDGTNLTLSDGDLVFVKTSKKWYQWTGSIWVPMSVSWEDIENKPSEFPPSPHQHGDSDLLGIDWSKVQNKPSITKLIYEDSGEGNVIADLSDLSVSQNESYIIELKTYPPQSSGYWILLLPNGISYTGSFYHREIYLNSDGSTQNVSGAKDYAIIARIGRYSHHLIFYFPGYGCISFHDARSDEQVRYILNYIKFKSIPASTFGKIQIEQNKTSAYHIRIFKR